MLTDLYLRELMKAAIGTLLYSHSLIANIIFSSLIYCLDTNDLTGQIPSEVGYLTMLGVLDFCK